MSLNRIEIIGHIGQDAIVKDFNSNQVISFNVAVTETYLNKEKQKVTNTVWFECAKWGNNTKLAQYLKKGQQVYISGKPNNRAWQSEQGEIKVVNGINIFDLQLLGSAKNNQEEQQSNQSEKQNNSDNPPVNNEDPDLPF